MRRNAKGKKKERGSDTSKVLVKLERGSEGFKRWLEEIEKEIETLHDAADLLEKVWDDFLAGEIDPIVLSDRLFNLLSVCGWETELRTQLRMVERNPADVSVRADKAGDDPSVTYYLPDPEPILDRLLDAHDGKVLFMSSTKPDPGRAGKRVRYRPRGYRRGNEISGHSRPKGDGERGKGELRKMAGFRVPVPVRCGQGQDYRSYGATRVCTCSGGQVPPGEREKSKSHGTDGS